VNSTYSQEQAQKNMYNETHWQGRTQYLEKYVWPLKPVHRLVEAKLRRVGILLPFGSSTDAYTEPNRLLFDKDGKWINARALRPFRSWDMREVIPSGAKHGCHEEDLTGCLFFHVKDQLAEFARRVRAWSILVYLTQFDAGELRFHVANKDPELVPFALGRFDRVDLPHLVDQLPDKHDMIFDYYGPFLNRANPHAALLFRTMAWVARRPGARAGTSALDTSLPLGANESVIETLVRKASVYLDFDPDDTERRAEQPLMLQMFDAWHNNQPAFEDYLRETHMKELLAERGLQLKNRNTIVPPRLDWPLSGRPETLPGLSKDDWYLLACVGRHDFLDRMFEVRVRPQ